MNIQIPLLNNNNNDNSNNGNNNNEISLNDMFDDSKELLEYLKNKLNHVLDDDDLSSLRYNQIIGRRRSLINDDNHNNNNNNNLTDNHNNENNNNNNNKESKFWTKGLIDVEELPVYQLYKFCGLLQNNLMPSILISIIFIFNTIISYINAFQEKYVFDTVSAVLFIYQTCALSLWNIYCYRLLFGQIRHDNINNMLNEWVVTPAEARKLRKLVRVLKWWFVMAFIILICFMVACIYYLILGHQYMSKFEFFGILYATLIDVVGAIIEITTLFTCIIYTLCLRFRLETYMSSLENRRMLEGDQIFDEWHGMYEKFKKHFDQWSTYASLAFLYYGGFLLIAFLWLYTIQNGFISSHLLDEIKLLRLLSICVVIFFVLSCVGTILYFVTKANDRQKWIEKFLLMSINYSQSVAIVEHMQYFPLRFELLGLSLDTDHGFRLILTLLVSLLPLVLKFMLK